MWSHTAPTLLLLTLAAPVSAQPATGEPQSRVRVRATLLDSDGEPARGVVIATMGLTDTDLAAALRQPLAELDADGRLDLDIALPGGEFRYLVVGGKAYASYRCALSARTAEPAPELDLGTVALAPGTARSGRVRGPDRQPLAGAVVECHDLLDTREFLQAQRGREGLRCVSLATTDAQGIFRLPGMVAAMGAVRVRCSGFLDATRAPVAVDTPLEFELHTARTVRGVVRRDDDAPVAGAYVSAGRARARSGADGRFTLQLRAADITELTASFAAAGVTWRGRAPVPADEQEATVRLLADSMAPRVGVRVRARSATGAPIDDFIAQLVWTSRHDLEHVADATLLSRSLHAAVQAQSGEAVLPGDDAGEELGVLFVRAVGHGLARLEIRPGAGRDEPVLATLPRAGSLRGKVVDPLGAPLAGVQVLWSPRVPDALRAGLATGFHTTRDFAFAPTSTATAADGTWQVDGLPPGRIEVFLHAPRFGSMPPLEVELREGATVDGLSFTVPRLRTLRGRLTGPLRSGMAVRPHWHRPGLWSSEWASELDQAVPVAPDGSFTLVDLPPREHRIELLVPAPPRGNLPVKLVCGEWAGATATDEPVELSMPEVATLRGRVAGDVPWSRLAVLATWSEGERKGTSSFAPRGPLALVPADRSFALRVPTRALRLLLLDPLTGIVLEMRDLATADLDRPIEFAGRAVPIELRISDDVANAQRACRLEYQPDDEHWPMGPGNVFERERKCMCTDVYSGTATALWLPARSGLLTLQVSGLRERIAVAALDGDVIDVVVGATRLQRR